jgi:hypothetical protein
MTNPLFRVKAPLSELKKPMLEVIREFQDLPPVERAKVLIEHYTEGGYLEAVRDWGKCDFALESLFEKAMKGIAEGSPAALEMTDQAISILKSKGVP